MERGRGDKDMYKRMLSFTGWNIFGSCGGVMRDQGLNMILNLFYGTVANAARGVAHQVMAACKSFVGNVTTASRPQLTQSYADGNLQRSVSIMHSMSKMCYISLFIFALPITLEVKFVLHIWLGDGVHNYTEIFLIWVMAEALIDVFNPPVSFMVHATGKMRKYQIIGTVVSLLSLPVAYFGLKNGWEPFSVFVVAFIFSIFRLKIIIKN